MENVIKEALKNKTGISLYEGKDFFSGYVTQIENGFAVMTSFDYDNDKEKYVRALKIKIALRRITQVYTGAYNDDLPALQDYLYTDFQHFYYDKEGLYFAETDKVLL